MTEARAAHLARPGGRWTVRRNPENRVVAGLAAGVAERLGIDPVYVRAGFIVLGFVFGLGVLLYLAGWAATSDQVGGTTEPVEPAGRSQLLGLGAVFLGCLLLLRSIGIWPGETVMWPVTAVTFGLAFLWEQREIDSRRALLSLVEPGGRWRLVIGAGLLLFGLSLLGRSAVPQVGSVMVAVLVTGAGLLLVLGPWLWRLAQDLGVERRERIRQEERAEMAAHLHDSVLQTLALIQRTEDPRRMATLARGQERELRRWLYERSPHDGSAVLSSALQAVAERVETDHDVPVEVVTVGDVPIDDRMQSLVQAAGEAITNAAKHSGARRVSVYAEVSDGTVEVWVADQGDGFDPEAVPTHRRGISESIVGRMRRHGGSAEVTAEPGEGTEVHLVLPREGS
ncbi:MAG: PspC domain-containing protein [Acidimicrobiia bacterium]|jgi:signal transduction histidine kinase